MRDSTGDTRNAGVRCLRISPDGQTLATGDRSGNIRFVFKSHDCTTFQPYFSLVQKFLLCLKGHCHSVFFSSIIGVFSAILLHSVFSAVSGT